MKTAGTFLVVLLLVLSGAAADSKSVSVQAQLEQISKDLSEKRIGRIEILQIPPRILTRARITPDMIEKQYHNKLIIRDINSHSYKGKLIELLKTVSASPHDETPDLRWAVIFYSQEETRVGAVYFDKSGQSGAVNSAGATFTGDFFNWLTATFSNCFQ
jgi:hypothetical protein